MNNFSNLRNSQLYIEDLDTSLHHVVKINKLCNKSVFVTGATGTIGSYVVDTLIRFNKIFNANVSLYLGGRNVEKLRNLFGTQKNVEYLSYDMFEPLHFNKQFDYVIHVAGNAHPAAFNGTPVETTIGNIDSTYRLLEYLKANEGKRFLYVSSGEVYGIGDVSLEAFDESYSGCVDVLSPRSCYPLSKRMTENLCASYWKQYGVETVIVRPCHTYGPFMTESDNRAHAQFFKNAVCGKKIVLKSSGTQMRSYNYVADCSSALLSVLLSGNPGEAYNLANSNSVLTIADLAKKIARAVDCEVVFDIPNAADLANQSPIPKQVLSSKKIERLGWKPAFSVDEGISHTLNMLR